MPVATSIAAPGCAPPEVTAPPCFALSCPTLAATASTPPKPQSRQEPQAAHARHAQQPPRLGGIDDDGARLRSRAEAAADAAISGRRFEEIVRRVAIWRAGLLTVPAGPG